MPVEPLLAGPETGPSLLSAGMRMALAVVLIGAAAWVWLYWQRKVKGPTRHLEVLDRAFLARGAAVALLRIDDRRLLVGVSSEGVRLLSELDPAAAPPAPERFADLLREAPASGHGEPA